MFRAVQRKRTLNRFLLRNKSAAVDFVFAIAFRDGGYCFGYAILTLLATNNF